MGKRGENIRKRKDGRWEARIISGYHPNGKARYRSFYGRTYLEAKTKRNDYLKNYSQYENICNTDPAFSRITVAQVMREWLDSRQGCVKDSTFAHYTNLLDRQILPELGTVRLSALTTEAVNDFLKEKLRSGRVDGRGGLSPKTVADIRSILLLGLEYAKQQRYPCAVKSKIFSPRLCKTPKRILTREEQSKLEGFLYHHPDSAALGILVTLYSGLRIGELCALQWGDIHIDSGTVTVDKTIIRIQNVDADRAEDPKTRILISQPKTESSNRFVPLPAFLMEFLDGYRLENEIFLITGTKFYMEPRIYLDKYKSILKDAGVAAHTFHALRHTFATRCIENGFDTKSLSEILGHANVSTTMQSYVHPSMELKKEQMNRLKSISVWGREKGQSDLENPDFMSDFEKKSYSVLL